MREPDYPDPADLHFGLTFEEEAETGPAERIGGEDPGLQGSPAYSKGFTFGLGCSLTPPLGLGLGLAPPQPGAHSPPPRRDGGGGGDIFGGLIEAGGRWALPCPTIRITSISPGAGAGDESGPEEEEEEAAGLPGAWAEFRGPWRPSRDHLYLPLDPLGHREPSLSPSPGSSPSSRGWASPSSCGSDLEAELSEAAWRASLASPRSSSSSSSPCPSPGPSLSPRPQASRPSSPGVKRPHAGLEAYLAPQASPSLSPAEDSPSTPRGTPPSPLPPPQAPAYPIQAAVPRKARRTGHHRAAGFYHQAETRPDQTTVAQQPAAQRDGMEYLTVPCPFTWSSKARALGQAPIFPSCSLPPLDWPLPSHCPPLELIVGVQPLPHHRAHYETEGSRGAVKAVGGGHPVVKLQGYTEKPVTLQLFIGTADERNLRPHTFYQVHRVTGKTVATGSTETLVHGTKVLEVPLLPENNMATSIDCAGILKLRNSDIELQKGETDIGRKNTRVKMVFRVHVPQSGGKVISLQTSSHPIECSQRSAQESPRVGGSSVAAAPVSGGQRVVISGTNFRPGARVLFMERGADGQNRWEAEAKVDNAETTETRIVAEVPPYPNQTVPTAVPVSFLVCNGRHKRSVVHSFTYLPVSVKEECPRRRDLGPVSPPLPPPSSPLPPPSSPLPPPSSPLPPPSSPLPPPSSPLPPTSLPLPSPEGSLGPPLPTAHSNAPGHPLTPPDLLGPANPCRPLTRANPGLPPSDQCQRLTHLNRGIPLAPGHHCRPLTHLNQCDRLAPAARSQPLTRDPPLALGSHCRLSTQRLAPVAPGDQWGEQRPVGRMAFYPEAPGRDGHLPSPGGPRPGIGIGTELGANQEETEGGDIPFNIIPIHGITLDDVNEIIRWDLSEVHECLRMEHP